MKTLYNTLQALIKEPPKFQPRLLVMKCPAFIVNAVLGKPRTEPRDTKHWWVKYPAVDARLAENNKIEYHPKYQ